MSHATPDGPAHLERLDPHERVDQEAANHWVRYDWAAGFLPARRVLDCACGVGYGTALLRERGAERVLGVDVSGAAIAAAQRVYAREGVGFHLLDALALAAAGLGAFDLIVSLETIEHVAEPQRLLDAFAALLAPGGTLALSCPNDRAIGEGNPYHLWTAEYDALRGWLAARFRHVDAYAQIEATCAAIWPVADANATAADALSPLRVRRVGDAPLDKAAGFLFACSQAGPPRRVAPLAAVSPAGFAYVRELEGAKRWLSGQLDSARTELENERQQVAQLRAWIAELEQARDYHSERAARQELESAELRARLEGVDSRAAALERTISDQRAWIGQLEEAKAWHDGQRQAAVDECARLVELLHRHEARLAELERRPA